ncbi:MAG TPA: Hsp20/alpha crystallin family protein [Parafilimonas sp.]|nr:Hsp20/alpha crystallin family protein [Parafilimonas sp.]
MKRKAFETNNTYPGEFVAARNEKKIIRHLKKISHKLVHPFINVTESVNLYEVQVSAPGLKREELIVFGNNNFLSVDASSYTDFSNKYKNFHHNINMPGNADTELTVAEYKNSVLHLYVPKTSQPVKNLSTRIVVY